MKNYKVYNGQNLKIDDAIINKGTMVNILQESATSTVALVETVYSNQGTRFQCAISDLTALKETVAIKLDYNKISNVFVGGIDMEDYGDFCDAYIESADYDGREMTDDELEVLNEDSQFVNESVFSQLY
jgi:hypothetical protein